MSNQPGVSTTLELLNRLKSTVEDFAAREAALDQEFRSRSAREQLRSDQLLDEATRKTGDEKAAADSNYAAARQAAEALHARRKSRIGYARTVSKEQSLTRIETRTGTRKYELQKKLMQAERDRDVALQNAAATCEQFKLDLTAENTRYTELLTRTQTAFRGYGGFRRRLKQALKSPQSGALDDGGKLMGELRAELNQAGENLQRLRKFLLPKIFSYLPPKFLVPLIFLPLLVDLLKLFQPNLVALQFPLGLGGAITLNFLFAFFGLHAFGGMGKKPLVSKISESLGKANHLLNAGFDMSGVFHQQEVDRIHAEFKATSAAVDADLKGVLKENVKLKGSFRETVDDKTVRVTRLNEETLRNRLAELERQHDLTTKRLREEADLRHAEAAKTMSAFAAELEAERESRWSTLHQEWLARLTPVYSALAASDESSKRLFPDWDASLVAAWTPPSEFAAAARFGQIDVEVDKLCDAVPTNPHLALPGPVRFSAPLCLAYPSDGSILFEMFNASREKMIGALNNVILRLLANSPPGRLNFSIIDPVGLGQNFAGVMHLADYEAQIINSRIWTQPAQIEQRLADLNEHMEKVIQMYLRNEYASIAEYNEQAGNIAEKYYFLVVADFPVNFSETAVKRLMSIAASGARCGVYTLIHWDQRQPAPPDLIPKDLRSGSVALSARGSDLTFTGKHLPGTTISLDAPPPPELATEFVHKLGRYSRDSSRVEVPFEHVAPPPEEVWSLETATELRVPIGRTGATKLQYLAIGKGTCQHALVAGKTGSGKSTLFHVIVTNLAMWCRPEQVEFYLVDFKKGVEFKCYASHKLPHARVVAIESDREFGLSVLQRVDDELRRRGDMFRNLGVQDVAGYKRAGGREPMPRTLLLIDEFQEFFVEDDKVSQTASVLLDRIVRQGRAFGIHVILGSQTLGGAYTLARTTIGQMVIRIALQCNEADAYLIMDESNPAPRLLSRPGEGIYNDSAGSVEGNSPFQVVWLPEEVRDARLDEIRQKADHSGTRYPNPVVFEGNAPADIRENEPLRELLASESIQPTPAPRIWLGAPNSIKGPTEAVFHRQSGNNLIVVGQREEATLSMLSSALVSLAGQFRPGGVRFVVFDGNPPGSASRDYLDKVAAIVPHPVELAHSGDPAKVINTLAEELKQRSADEQSSQAPAVFLLFHGLQRFGKLRFEEEFGFSADESGPNPGAQLNDLITGGATRGIHVVATIDTYNNVNRWLSRKALAEFEMRVLFQMSVNDSASLIDNPKASMLGLHRALFYNEQEGYLETFRPYALPDSTWIQEAAQNLARLVLP